MIFLLHIPLSSRPFLLLFQGIRSNFSLCYNWVVLLSGPDRQARRARVGPQQITDRVGENLLNAMHLQAVNRSTSTQPKLLVSFIPGLISGVRFIFSSGAENAKASSNPSVLELANADDSSH